MVVRWPSPRPRSVNRSRSSASPGRVSSSVRTWPQALVAVRLCDVWPDGASTLITRGIRNLTHRHGDEEPVPLVPGERFVVEVALNSIAYVVPAGHRLRLSVSPTYWPVAWPSPEPATLTITTSSRSVLEIPVRRRGIRDPSPPGHFSEPAAAPAPIHIDLGTLHTRNDACSETPGEASPA